MLTTKPNSNIKTNITCNFLENQNELENDESNKYSKNENSSMIGVQKARKKNNNDNINKKTKHKNHKHKKLINSESSIIKEKSISINDQKELRKKHSNIETISNVPSSPTLHRSPSKEYLPISTKSHIPLSLPLTSLVPSINLPFSPSPSVSNNKVILNPIIPHPPIKPMKNEKIFSRKRYTVVSNSTSITTSSKII